MDQNKYLKKIAGDTLVITVKQPLLPLKGMAELIDWRLNSLFSRLLVQNKQGNVPVNPILLPSKDRLPVEKVLIINLDKSTKDSLVKNLKGLKSKDCSIVFPKDFKKELNTFFSDELKKTSLSWDKIEEINIGDEILITLSKIQYV